MSAAASTSSRDWRSEAFGAIAVDGLAAPAVAAAALWASVGTVPGQWACIASPLHLVAGMSTVTLAADGLLHLEPTESVALATDFNRVFGDAGVRLVAGRASLLVCVFERALRVVTHDPSEVIGSDVFGCQPAGHDAGSLRRLMSEMELWLYDHAINRTRAMQGRFAITGLWLWGGGSMVSTLPAVRGWTAGTDPLFAAFGDTPMYPQGVGRAGTRAGAGVLVCGAAPGSAQWPTLEREWLEPISAALRGGALDQVKVSVDDRAITVDGGRNWRFWRRPRPWWEKFGLERSDPHGDQ